MDYSFNANIAVIYGVNEAIFIQNLYWWIAKNEANGRHYYDGRSWTYNSMEAFTTLFPFWTRRQVRTIIEKLEAAGALYCANYNEKGFDRTKWYALSEDILNVYQASNFFVQNSQKALTEKADATDRKAQCNRQKSPMQRTEKSNATDEKVLTIPDSKPDSKPNINTDSKPDNRSANADHADILPDTSAEPRQEKKKQIPYQAIQERYNKACTSLAVCTVLSESRKKAIKARFGAGYTEQDFATLFCKAQSSSFLKGANQRNWCATFDWLIKDSNMAKVLDGNYDDDKAGFKQTPSQGNASTGDLWAEYARRAYEDAQRDDS